MKLKDALLIVVLTCFTLFLSASVTFAYTDYHRLGSPSASAYGVTGWFKENMSERSLSFPFTGIEVLPLSQYKPSPSEVDSFVKSFIGSDCYIEFDKDRARNQAYVWKKNPEGQITEEFVRNNLVNAALVEKGYARVLDYGPNQKYVSYLLKLEKEAKEKRLGIWQ